MMWERSQGQARSQSLLGSWSEARFILGVVRSHQRGVIIRLNNALGLWGQVRQKTSQTRFPAIV